MSTTVLASKWRPHRFSEVVGQDYTVQTLSYALDSQRLHQAYLFTGTRGVGKTTFARIIAKCLNCEKGISSTPCDQCSSCQEIDKGRFIDLIEVDAASKTKVDDTRELLENIQYAPTKGRYKVYIIDEVHMLSNHSFNALLKTLEEPPPHILFLLATTEPQKLPKTVRSRCLQFHLHTIEPSIICKRLQYILEQEQIAYESPALQALSLAAEGSLRDALSLLDQGIAYSNGHVTTEAINRMLGNVDHTHLFALLTALHAHDGEALFNIVDKLNQLGAQFTQVTKALLQLLHQIALRQALPGRSINLPFEDQELQQFTSILSPEEVQLYYQILLKGQDDILHAPSEHSGFEMLMLRMLCFTHTEASPSPATPRSIAPTSNASTTTSSTVAAPCAMPTPTATMQKPADNASQLWQQALPQLDLTGVTLMIAQNSHLEKMSDTHYTLHIAESQRVLVTDKHKQRIHQTLRNYFSTDIQLTFLIGETPALTPHQHKQATLAEQQQRAEDSIQQDELVQRLAKQFDATIVPGSIKAHSEIH